MTGFRIIGSNTVYYFNDKSFSGFDKLTPLGLLKEIPDVCLALHTVLCQGY